jgi:hypothetical protein
MVDLACLLFDPMSQFVVEYFYFKCLFMVLSLLDSFGLSHTPEKPPNWFNLVQTFPLQAPFSQYEGWGFLSL